ncbi:MAG TPA: molybdopterin molybdotransferase MoeA [Denitromonas sp.]|nr:molybdopterin molybdotransferase MoeA [Rhodocyclaceae bacterium]MCP5220712.1 molybdopterin molybdotransferase MoeA [Zoogloeaceae bacterium]HQU86989.1 molybdopterin molybdotransferase MoeA [Denitromonas sp.]HQV13339.1 molybdopterin molybdotransferase MoeA [Denitromonas sp.]
MSLLSFEDARTQLLAQARPVAGTELVSTLKARGRVLADDLVSEFDVPPLDNSAMDGYAVRCADIASAGACLPVSQRIPAGTVGHPLAAGSVARIFTGAPIPPGADAVVMQELCERDGEKVTINHLPQSGDSIRRRGEDIAVGQAILTAGTRLRAQELGLAASIGIPAVSVHRRLKVAIFFTGDELVMPGEPLREGAIYNSNRFVLNALLEGMGCEVTDLGIVADTLDATRQALRTAAHGHDVIITSGGVSVGEEDHVKPAVEAEGSLDLWNIAIKPGKPLAYGRVGEAAFIGLPGNPVSTFVTFLLLVRPFLLKAQGVREVLPKPVQLRADFDWLKPIKRREFLRVQVNADGGLSLFDNQGSGVLTSTVWADGLAEVPPGEPIRRGQMVSYYSFSDLLD